ncbi:serine hydrolase domain-containing protein [Streptomyces sp. NPDC058653]|uniref:serine hydrolase domain-containing protein n=1 Tax=Streptomyces sp. NPDC058653 TaxID=3346576 RepID=UPI003662A752
MSREMTAAATETETRTGTATLTWPRTGTTVTGTGAGTGTGRHGRRVVAAALLAPALFATAVPVAAAREALGGGVRHQVDLLVERDGVPGALAHVNGRTFTAGTAELGTDRPIVGADAHFRLASDTKAFTAAAVMRLVADGKVRLDSPARRYVPQLAENPVTVRELLKQRSGLPEYSDLIDWSDGPYTDEDCLALALAKGQDFEPGSDWAYSNTNYLVLGLVIDNTSGEDYRGYIERTVLRPLGLRDTYWPAPGEPTLRGPHARDYGHHPADPEGGVVDMTELPGHGFGPSGGLVSTPKDLNAFWEGLFDGRLLPGWAVRQMTDDTTDVGGLDVYPQGSRYGYGVASIPLSCGGEYWGHGGDLPGNSVGGSHATTGRGDVTVSTTTAAASGDRLRHLRGAVDAALCTGRQGVSQ